MFYIEKLSKINRRDITALQIVPALLVFLVFLCITLWNWYQLRHSLQQQAKEVLAKNVDTTRDSLIKSVSGYENVLNAGVGLFDASEYVSHDEWAKFINIFDIKDSYPGMNSVGFAKLISKNEQPRYIKSFKSKEHISLKIHPAGSRAVYAPVTYSESANGKNSASGYDMYANQQMRSAMAEARDSGEPALTGRLTLSKDSPFGQAPTVLIYSPIYVRGSQTDTIEKRRKNITGYIYGEILTYKLVNEFYNPINMSFGFAIRDNSSPGEPVLYQSPNFDSVGASQDLEPLNRQFAVNNRRWAVSGLADTDILPARDRNRPSNILGIGLLASVFLSVFIYTLLLNRTRVLSYKEKEQIESAKDELLALASHQLRTPATGVKQYIGMLLEGYGGKLTTKQKKLLDQAYRSNERQLHTINDMLFVARADTGNIEFSMAKTDVLEFITDILEEQQQMVKDKNQSIVKNLPKKSFSISADKRYLRMAVENLLSNASKYTPAGGTIMLSLKKTKSSAIITVEDTGVGIHQKYAHLLFQKFSRVPNDLTNQVSGSGIGLYLAKKVVDAHGGKIEFKSAPNKGSACMITLPLKKHLDNTG